MTQETTSRLIRNAMQTPDGTILESRSRHDYVTYKDTLTQKQYMLDGGLDYVRCSANGDEVFLSIDDTVSHQLQREILKWGTYGKTGDKPLTLKPIALMDTDHIRAVLKECNPAYVYEQCMLKELKERS